MENASKALIIAGAILLSILIIALGIYVFNMAKNATNTDQLSQLEITQFNEAFTDYEGNKLGSAVSTLLDNLVSNSVTNKDADERLPDILYLDNRGANAKPAKSQIDGSADPSEDAKKFAKAAGFNESEAIWMITSNSSNPNTDNIGSIRNFLATKHYYKVGFHKNNTTGLIDFVFISY